MHALPATIIALLSAWILLTSFMAWQLYKEECAEKELLSRLIEKTKHEEKEAAK